MFIAYECAFFLYSEMYSLMIEAFVKDPAEQHKLFHAV